MVMPLIFGQLLCFTLSCETETNSNSHTAATASQGNVLQEGSGRFEFRTKTLRTELTERRRLKQKNKGKKRCGFVCVGHKINSIGQVSIDQWCHRFIIQKEVGTVILLCSEMIKQNFFFFLLRLQLLLPLISDFSFAIFILVID